MVASDVSPTCVRALRERFAGHPNVRVEDRDLRTLELDERFDSVLMVNVLEHIADDVEALRGPSRLLVPGGNVVVYVPALNGLYGALDRRSATIAVTRSGACARSSARQDSSPSSFAGELLRHPGLGRVRPGDVNDPSAAAGSSRCGIEPRCRPGASSRRMCEYRSG